MTPPSDPSDLPLNLDLDLQCSSTAKNMPDNTALKSWISAALHTCQYKGTQTLTVRIVDEPEIQSLNNTYRNKDKPTNVLSFPNVVPAEFLEENYLGDIIVCAPIIAKEAQAQQKNETAHWAHMMVHSTLHLLGYDHQIESEAHHMENCEKIILNKLGFPDPYISELMTNNNED